MITLLFIGALVLGGCVGALLATIYMRPVRPVTIIPPIPEYPRVEIPMLNKGIELWIIDEDRTTLH